MAANITLTRPHAGQSITQPVGPDARLEFAFDQNDGVLAKEGQDLVLTFNDGGKLVLEGFYANFTDNAQPPTLIVQGHELDGQAFLSAYDNPDLMPAAGPTAASAIMGGGAYEDAMLHGVGGVDMLDKLTFDGMSSASNASPVYESQNNQMTQEQPLAAAAPSAVSAGPPPVIHGAYQIGSSGNDNGSAGSPPIIGEAGKQNILIGDSDTPLNVPKLNLVIAIDVGSSDGMTRGTGGQLDMVKQAVDAYLTQLKDYPNDFSVEVLLIHSTKYPVTGGYGSQWLDLGSRLLRTATDSGKDTYETDLPGVLAAVNNITMETAKQVGQADFAGAFTKASSFFNAYNNPDHADGYWTGGGKVTSSTATDTWVPSDTSEYVNKMVIISASNNLGGADPSAVLNNPATQTATTKYSPVEVDVIAVGNNASALGGLTDNGGTVADLGGVSDAQALQDAIVQSLNQQLTPVDLYQAGSDVLIGADQNDFLFGDALNSAALAQLAHDQLTVDNYNHLSGDFSAAAVFAALEQQGWSQDDIAGYVQTHADAFAVENPGTVSGGNDLLVGGGGNDHIYGQYGDDVLFAGNIHLTTDLPGGGGHEYAGTQQGVAEFLHDLQASGPVTGDLAHDLAAYQALHPDQSIFGDGTAADGNNYLDGGSGNDILVGGGGTDTLNGGAGDDLIYTGGGNNNLVHGGDGNDTIYIGGGDHNVVYGDAGDDVIYAGSGHNNVIYGGAGNDIMHANATGSATFAWNPTTDFDGGTDKIDGFKVDSDHLSFGDLFDTTQPISDSAIQALLDGSRSDGQTMSVSADTVHNTITLTISEGTTVQQTVEVSFASTDLSFVQAVQDDHGNDAAQAQHLMHLITNVGG